MTVLTVLPTSNERPPYLAARTGCRIGQVPLVFIERQEGYSKVPGSVRAESLWTPWRLVLGGGRLKRASTR